MIRFSCPTCRFQLEVLPSLAATKLLCPQCGQKLRVPTPPAKKAGTPTTCDQTLLGKLEDLPPPVITQEMMEPDVELVPISMLPAPPRAPSPVPAATADPFRNIEQPGTRRRPSRSPDRRIWLAVPVMVLLFLLVGGIALVFAYFLFTDTFRSTNARCPTCGRRFHIAEEHRGTIAEYTREYPCPNCGTSWPAKFLYDSNAK
jgi:ssDNA-binding Zn-finger/Zn-ribbon topoisomerase 1